MPLIGRMQALSSADSDIFWWHKPYLSFWQCLERYLVTMDPNFRTLIQTNFISWLLTHFTCYNTDKDYSNLDGENISHATCWTDEFEIINIPKPSCRFHRWCPWCRFHRRYNSCFFWLEGFRIKASSKSIVKSIVKSQQFINVDENGSVANAHAQNMAFFWNDKVKMKIREAGQSSKSTTLTSHITWQVLVLALSYCTCTRFE